LIIVPSKACDLRTSGIHIKKKSSIVNFDCFSLCIIFSFYFRVPAKELPLKVLTNLPAVYVKKTYISPYLVDKTLFLYVEIEN